MPRKKRSKTKGSAVTTQDVAGGIGAPKHGEAGPVSITMPPRTGTSALPAALAQVATSLWYLKTKHFKQKWEDLGSGPTQASDRRALGRIEKAIEALAEVGVEVRDPTNTRYAPGGEGLMRPIEFVPTAGIDHEIVTETMRPIIYFGGHLAQRAEVFIAVPKAGE